MTEFQHETVMLRETVEGVAARAGGTYVDVTLGGAGHSAALLEASAPDGRLFAVDRDASAIEAARERLLPYGARVTFVHGPFSELRYLLQEQGVVAVDGVLADLGVSSPQLDLAQRGFSFARPGPIDMRMDPSSGEPAIEKLRQWTTDELANVLFEYGEERKSRAVARSIKAALELDELQTTEDLRRSVVRVLGPRRSGIDPATRTFQALRMAVNDEVGELEALLQLVPQLLVDGGRLSIISFHSGEDRRVKHTFRDDPRYRPITKRPLEASPEECANNPRSRSAKLRVAERVAREIAP